MFKPFERHTSLNCVQNFQQNFDSWQWFDVNSYQKDYEDLRESATKLNGVPLKSSEKQQHFNVSIIPPKMGRENDANMWHQSRKCSISWQTTWHAHTCTLFTLRLIHVSRNSWIYENHSNEQVSLTEFLFRAHWIDGVEKFYSIRSRSNYSIDGKVRVFPISKFMSCFHLGTLQF